MFSAAVLAALSLVASEAGVSPSNELTVEADGDAIAFTAGKFEGRARKLRFSHSDGLLILEGKEQSPVTVQFMKEGRTKKLRARRIRISIPDGRFSAHDLESAATKPLPAGQ